MISRVIDGDTIVANNYSIRLLGINAPEKGERFYFETKELLENLVLDKKVELEIYGKDRYHRKLAYVYIDGINVNIELVKKGFANVYLLDKRKYEKELKEAWKNCINENKNLCEKSKHKCANCIELKDFDYKNEEIIFYNRCNFDCNLDGWEIKDEGRKKFIFNEFILKGGKEIKIIKGGGEDKENILFWKINGYIWTDSGDTLFLRDNKGKLVLYHSY